MKYKLTLIIEAQDDSHARHVARQYELLARRVAGMSDRPLEGGATESKVIKIEKPTETWQEVEFNQ